MKKRSAKSPGLNADDRHIWRRVTRTVSPLKKRDKAETSSGGDEEDAWLSWVEEQGMVDRPLSEPVPSVAPTLTTNSDTERPKAKPPAVSAATEKRASSTAKKQIFEIERPTHRKLAKGRLPIDARLDLHHQTQNQAHQSLQKFLANSYRLGHRHVLVITGKGRSVNSQGVLKKMLPIWVSTHPINMFVSGIRHASRDHGGEGAWYIRLKRKQPGTRS
ncbi:MAG: Smr/MutS family protein [Pseudomonadota bacterium]